MRCKTVLAGWLILGLAACATAGDPEAVERHLSEGKTAYEEEKYERALRSFNAVIRLDSREGRAHLWRGNACLKMARSENTKGFSRDYENRALANYNEAIRVNPTLSLAFWNRAMIRAKRARYKDAVRDLLEFAKREPRHPEPHLLIGKLYEEKFEDASLRIRALEHYEQFITLGGRDDDVLEKVRAWQELKNSMAPDIPRRGTERPLAAPEERRRPEGRQMGDSDRTGNPEAAAARTFEEYKRLFGSDRPEDRALAMERVRELLSTYAETEVVQSRKRYLELILRNMESGPPSPKSAEE